MNDVTVLTDLVDESEACRIVGGANTPIHRSTLYRQIRAGHIPKPLKICGHSNRWIRGELLDYLRQAAEAREVV